ncbi:TRAP transporter substrate-binding protein [Desulfopila aestuarii]|uniref:TRAP-type C4-dicarboxylate transport system, substrate-binding protein n=1 Tax=Desulfopila aestuarii DSM 18488 TaxID=1121416 RepID=A0A1M7YIF6_9BACT|nr:TRAP transporter substrate-binding protein [Desulfopila aestuarii]SHO52381.1 TRAP-type C4-dicarboxylate transport system, substrate-binding protein [Desulfopila aestuarii DSM 18488]
MKQHRSLIVVMVIFVFTAIITIAPHPTYAKEVQLTYSGFFPPNHVQSKLAEAWCKEVEKQTEGRVKIAYYPGQTLTKATQTYDGVLTGLSDIGFSILQYSRGRFPLMDFINLPMGYPSGPVNTAIINEVYEKFAPAELDDVKVLYLHAHGPGVLHTKKHQIHEMKDFKGLKFRSHGPTADMLKNLGGTPSALPMPELYQALQKGVVQGGVWDFSASSDWKLAEVVDCDIVCSTISYSLGFFVVMNKDKWAMIDDSDQKIIEKINAQWLPKHGKTWEEVDSRAIQYSLSLGNTIIGIPPKEAAKWRKAVQPVIDSYIEETKSKGLPGKEVIKYVEKRIKDAEKGKFESKYL